MAIELSTSQKFSSSYQVVPGDLSRANLLRNGSEMAEDSFKGDLEGGLIIDHTAGGESAPRFRSRGSDYSREPESSPPRTISPSGSAGADEFIDIKVSFCDSV